MEITVALITDDKKSAFDASTSITLLKENIEFYKIPDVKITQPEEPEEFFTAGDGILETFLTIFVSTQLPIIIVETIKTWLEIIKDKKLGKTNVKISTKLPDGTDVEITSSNEKEVMEWLEKIKLHFEVKNA